MWTTLILALTTGTSLDVAVVAQCRAFITSRISPANSDYCRRMCEALASECHAEDAEGLAACVASKEEVCATASPETRFESIVASCRQVFVSGFCRDKCEMYGLSDGCQYELDATKLIACVQTNEDDCKATSAAMVSECEELLEPDHVDIDRCRQQCHDLLISPTNTFECSKLDSGLELATCVATTDEACRLIRRVDYLPKNFAALVAVVVVASLTCLLCLKACRRWSSIEVIQDVSQLIFR